MKAGKLLYSDTQSVPGKFALVESLDDGTRSELRLTKDEVLALIAAMAVWLRGQ